jgi:hypothetical protein
MAPTTMSAEITRKPVAESRTWSRHVFFGRPGLIETSRLLKNPPHGARDGSDGGRVICETKSIWSHYQPLDREKSLLKLVPSLRKRAGPLQSIDATTPWRGFVEQITLLPGLGQQAVQ